MHARYFNYRVKQAIIGSTAISPPNCGDAQLHIVMVQCHQLVTMATDFDVTPAVIYRG